MYTTIHNIRLHYDVMGSGSRVLILHGWGSDLGSFASVRQHLAKKYCVYALDLPGFGESPAPESPWGTTEYAALVERFIVEMGIENPAIIGHSFGGRLAIRLATKMPVRKLILVDSAGVKPRRSLNYYLKVYSYKLMKNVLGRLYPPLLEKMRGRAGSEDYRNASPVMRQTLVKVVNEDLTPLLSGVKAPTLLVWGENDLDTPLYQAKVMEAQIPDCGLALIKGAGHFSYLERPGEFQIIVDYFLKMET
ncbi:MAG: alpha/beta hydrolase [gamma proteobacterium endosymbiont of Lamellibrachia anaximandri]|nr:alpha/beta hydrolase [gamma proteobacterium endosymbiont of Lamellibrachia anaximandri]MBL3533264.1 alpha/beta hydrolase [gamma proteobacterium endosymbiont of Lamellibrachia anaximandri]